MTAWPVEVGAPPDGPAAAAVVLAAILVWQGPKLFAAFVRGPARAAVLLLASLAALLSAAYVHHYLRGGPRIIDATSYWLEAKALAQGHVTWPIEEPSASIRGRFLLLRGPPDAPRLGVIFPPGYPLLLAAGFLLRVPLLIGPLTAALLVWVTYVLARQVTHREDVARVAAFFSVICATLRYHTADTMSHGWAALLLAAALAFVYRATDAPTRPKKIRNAALAGLALGWLFATRPISAFALLPVLAVATFRVPAAARLALVGGAVVPVVLFVLQQRALTGTFFRSSQAAYYAIADGPPGCFRYGFGRGIGCLHEHGEYVASVLPHGLGWGAAVLTSLRRLRLHLADIANAEPLAVLAFAAPFLARRSSAAPRTAHLGLAAMSLFIAYVPFYFDGSYPGGGARLFADALPLEHVLMAVSLGLLDDYRKRHSFVELGRSATVVGGVSALGFGVHAVFGHLMLRDREGGRPLFEPSVVSEAKVDHGLLFVGTDHAFNLAYEPNARDPRADLVVAHEYGDDRDKLLWQRLGQPPAYRYVFDGHERSRPVVLPWSPRAREAIYRFEAEAEWPPLEQEGGYFEPVFAQGTCAWGGRLLAIRSSPERAF